MKFLGRQFNLDSKTKYLRQRRRHRPFGGSCTDSQMKSYHCPEAARIICIGTVQKGVSSSQVPSSDHPISLNHSNPPRSLSTQGGQTNGTLIKRADQLHDLLRKKRGDVPLEPMTTSLDEILQVKGTVAKGLTQFPKTLDTVNRFWSCRFQIVYPRRRVQSRGSPLRASKGQHISPKRCECKRKTRSTGTEVTVIGAYAPSAISFGRGVEDPSHSSQRVR